MARHYSQDSRSQPAKSSEDSRDLWHRFDSRCELRARLDALSAEIGMAATWNPALMQRVAEITAVETRAAGIPWTFSPVLDLGRQPLWPRFYETFGEDPYLAKVMGAAFVRGIEGDDISSANHIATSLKHYVGYSFPLNGRDRTTAWIPENYLREYFL